MASRGANPRRAVSRPRTNDENTIPTQSHSQTLRTKSSLSQIAGGTALPSKSAPTTQHVKKAGSVGTKPGTKRTALGGVVGNGVKEELIEDVKPVIKSVKVETQVRQPLSSRNGVNNTQPRPIAPVPHRAKNISVYPTIKQEDEFSNMDVDIRRDNIISKIEEEGSMGEMSEEELEDEEEGGEEEEDEEEDDEDWLRMSEEEAVQCQRELGMIRSAFHDEVDQFDTTMVAEYADDIFAHMEDLEGSVMPNPRYMDFQTEIEWTMRTTLIDWLLQVHLRYHMLPETLWIAVNLVDRFLSVRVVSLVKLQLVGVTAMFIAAKYEEILAPSVEEFVFMTENGYTKDEILKGERIILQTLDFTVSSYCSPYSWVRRISKADDYDLQTRTLSKFLMEVTLLDHRFLRCKPSMVAAVGMYLARKMLGGDWNDAFCFYSNFTETQLVPGASLLCERLIEADFESVYVYKKYANKKFLRASTFARDWAQNHAATAW